MDFLSWNSLSWSSPAWLIAAAAIPAWIWFSAWSGKLPAFFKSKKSHSGGKNGPLSLEGAVASLAGGKTLGSARLTAEGSARCTQASDDAHLPPSWLTLGCHALLLTVIVVALAGPHWKEKISREHVIVAVDHSRSIDSNGRKLREETIRRLAPWGGGATFHVLPFGGKPGEIMTYAEYRKAAAAEVSDSDPQNSDPLKIDPLHSNPALAISLAAAGIPPDAVGRIVLLTDGNAPQNDLLAAAVGSCVSVDVIPLSSGGDPDVCLVSLDLPFESPGTEDRLRGQVEAFAVSACSGKLVLERADGETNTPPLRTIDLNLAAGKNVIPFVFPLAFGDSAHAAIRAKLEGFGESDLVPENNVRRAVVMRQEAPRAALIAGRESPVRQIAEAIRSAGFVVSEHRLGEASGESKPGGPTPPLSLDGPEAPSVVILCETPDSQIPADFKRLMGPFIVNGGAVAVLGGERVFGIEAYRGSFLEKLLPVTAAEKPPEQKQRLSLVLVIDRSQSMEEGGKLELAREATRQTIDLLTPQDQVGIVAFGSTSEWIVPLAPAADKGAIKEQVAKLLPKGATRLYPALRRAWYALEQDLAERRQIIVLTDGVSSPGDFAELAAGLKSSGIGLTTVSVTAEADQTILKDMETVSGGRHVHCENPADIPRILAQEAKTAVGAIQPTRAPLLPLRLLPGLSLEGAPPLENNAATSPKRGAEVVLVSSEGDPLLTWWRRGEGISLAFAAGPSDWGAPWRDWPGFAPFWRRLASHLRRTAPAPTATLWSSHGEAIAAADYLPLDRDDAGEVAMHAAILSPQQDSPQEKSPWHSLLTRPGDGEPLAAIAPGRFGLEFAAEAPGIYLAKIAATRNERPLWTVGRGMAVDYPHELIPLPANVDLLRQAAEASGGSLFQSAAEQQAAERKADLAAEAGKESPNQGAAGNAAQIAAIDRRHVERTIPLAPRLAVAAAVLLTLEAWLRRRDRWRDRRREFSHRRLWPKMLDEMSRENAR